MRQYKVTDKRFKGDASADNWNKDKLRKSHARGSDFKIKQEKNIKHQTGAQPTEERK